jgi:hypothetical protein
VNCFTGVANTAAHTDAATAAGTSSQKPGGRQQEATMSKITLLRRSALAIAIPLAFAITIGTAAAGCQSGYVWRDAKDGDGACVTPGDRAEAKAQNANADNNRQAGGGASGPNTCRQGYVWREAFGGDVVCVTPYERQKAKDQNAASPSHSTN